MKELLSPLKKQSVDFLRGEYLRKVCAYISVFLKFNFPELQKMGLQKMNLEIIKN